ncbi:MAG TPA: hypothetical protein VGY98_07795 [Verrucomicrobiae bacterium]|nr:hypothetical protein [Verrucomicrobiae bacterium]
MKTLPFIIPGALGLLLALSLTSCSTSGSSSPQTAASGQPAPEANSSSAGAPSVAGATPVSLANIFNIVGIVPDNSQFTDSLDGDGNDCSSNVIHDSCSWKGVPFQLGSASKGANVVTCNGQTIPLPAGKFSKLEMLATGVNGAQASQNFVITYSDPSLDQTNTQSVSDWYQPDGNTGEAQVIDMDYRDQSDGSRDDEPFYIYGYSFDLKSGGTATGLVLPSNNNLKVFAVTLVP